MLGAGTAWAGHRPNSEVLVGGAISQTGQYAEPAGRQVNSIKLYEKLITEDKVDVLLSEEEFQHVGGKPSLQSESGDVGSRLGRDTFGDGEFLHPGFKEHASCVSSEQRGEDGVGVDDEPRGLS